MQQSKKKSVHTNLWQNRIVQQKLFQGELYEIPSFYLRRALSVTRYCVKGKSHREIAGLLGGNVSSVPRELRRNCSLQKGTNKNLNGLLREFYPQRQKPFKGKAFDIEKEPGAHKCRAQKGFTFQNAVRIVAGKAYQVLHLVLQCILSETPIRSASG